MIEIVRYERFANKNERYIVSHKLENIIDGEFETLKERFYDRMSEVSHSIAKNMCYIMVNETLSFVNNYPNQDVKLIEKANDLAVSFLNSFEHRIFNAIEISKKH